MRPFSSLAARFSFILYILKWLLKRRCRDEFACFFNHVARRTPTSTPLYPLSAGSSASTAPVKVR